MYVLSQSEDQTFTTVTAIDKDGFQKFQLTVPVSHQRSNVANVSGGVRCRTSERDSLIRTATSKLFVNVDGFAYLAFTQNDWTVMSDSCPSGPAVDLRNVHFARSDRIRLWQIHPDGTYRDTVI